LSPPPADLDTRTGLPVRSGTPNIDPAASRSTDPAREEVSLAFCLAAAKSLEGDKCTDVMVIDLRGRSQVTDFFVIATGTSDRQVHSSADHVADSAEHFGLSLFRSNLDEPQASWIVLDFVDVVVHVFMPEARLYYDLEMLWGEAPRVAWKDGMDLGGRTKSGSPLPAVTDRNRAGLTSKDVLPRRESDQS